MKTKQPKQAAQKNIPWSNVIRAMAETHWEDAYMSSYVIRERVNAMHGEAQFTHSGIWNVCNRYFLPYHVDGQRYFNIAWPREPFVMLDQFSAMDTFLMEGTDLEPSQIQAVTNFMQKSRGQPRRGPRLSFSALIASHLDVIQTRWNNKALFMWSQILAALLEEDVIKEEDLRPGGGWPGLGLIVPHVWLNGVHLVDLSAIGLAPEDLAARSQELTAMGYSGLAALAGIAGGLATNSGQGEKHARLGCWYLTETESPELRTQIRWAL